MFLNIKNLAPFLLASSLIFAPFTQFRFFFLGFSEILFIFTFFLLFNKIIPFFDSHKFKLLNISAFIIFLIVGSLINLVSGISFVNAYDAFGWVYVIVFMVAVGIASSRFQDGFIFVTKGICYIPYFLFATLVLSYWGIFDVWFADESGNYLPFVSRFIGPSLNPNQLGFYLCALPYIVYFSYKEGFIKKLNCFLALSIAILIGMLVRSNTVFVAWIFGLLSYGSLLLFKNSIKKPITSILLLFFLFTIFSVNIDLVVSQFSKGDDAGGRYPIWSTFPEIFSKSPFFGFGPGSHAGIGSPFQGWELHSLPLDIISQGGFLSFLIFLIMFSYSCFLGVRSRQPLVIIIALCAFVEMLTHNTQRHPIFWIYIFFPFFYYLYIKRINI